MNLDKYKHVQSVAKTVLNDLGKTISPNSTERSIAASCIEMLATHGIHETWYHQVPAFVLLGSRSCLSVSGREYVPASEEVDDHNLVTVDLSPLLDSVWGDCARSFCIEDGMHSPNPKGQSFSDGVNTEFRLHELMKSFVSPGTEFRDLHEYGNQQINLLGYENLDFLGNLGHSIDINPTDRHYIDSNCSTKLGEVSYFTFEPHIRKTGQSWGFKHENIYYFDSAGVVMEL